jgi:hypothetical protein
MRPIWGSEKKPSMIWKSTDHNGQRRDGTEKKPPQCEFVEKGDVRDHRRIYLTQYWVLMTRFLFPQETKRKRRQP